jgi:hypothetical protein
MKRIYVAGPYSGGDTVQNVRNAIDVADELADAGFAPFVPHLCHFWHYAHPRDYQSWLDIDLAWVDVCDAVFRLGGESSGADGEVERAIARGIPVFYSIAELIHALA